MAFVRTVKTKSSTGEIQEYVRIVENYRKKGKHKQCVIANLGNVSSLRKDIKSIVNGLLRVVGEKSLVFADDAENEHVKEYGVKYLGSSIWNSLGLGGVLNRYFKRKKVSLEYGRWIEMMVINRLSDPKSKLGIFDWLSRSWWPNHSFSDKVADREIDEDKRAKVCKKEVMKFYRGLDYLLDMKEMIENYLYLKFRDLFSIGVDLVFYDLTSSYFEGNGPSSLGSLGYSRDHEPGKPQIVIGLLLCNGLPIGHEVFEGRCVDKKTVKKILSKLRKQYNIQRCIFIGDRGLISKENIKELESYEGFDSILALRKRRNNEVKDILLGHGDLIYCRLNDELEYREIRREDGLRFIVCRNPVVASFQSVERKKNIAYMDRELLKLKEKIDKQKRPSLKRIVQQVEKILSHHHGKRLFKYELDEKTRCFKFSMHEENIKLEDELDGIYILRTHDQEFSPEQIIDSYKDLQDVERAFRVIKSPLRLRPINHHKDERVRAHVFVCVLSYVIEKVVEKQLRKANIDITGERVFSIFKQMGVAVMKVENEFYAYTSAPTYTQKKVLNALNIELPQRLLMENFK